MDIRLTIALKGIPVEFENQYTHLSPLELRPTILEGSCLRLEPLDDGHIEELLPLFNPAIWEWYTVRIADLGEFRSFMKRILSDHRNGHSLAFAIRERTTGQLIGSSRFLNIDSANRVAEIGSTWLAPQWQRTFANTESKLLMLTHAFERLSCISVHFQTDILNKKSRAAIERLGAKLDGIIRNHRICHDGRIRSSAYYSITSAEWNGVRDRLQNRMKK